MNAEQEQEWIAVVRDDPQAFKRLYDYYFPRLYAYVSYRVGRVQDTEDLVAETFLKVIENIDSFEWRHTGSFAAWIFSIAHNLVINFRRRQKRRDFISLNETPDMRANTVLPEDFVLQKEKFLIIYWLINSLAPRQQEIITLRFFGGLRNHEIARILGLDERTVAAYLCRGLETLHQRYIAELSSNEEGIVDE